MKLTRGNSIYGTNRSLKFKKIMHTHLPTDPPATGAM